MFLRILYFGEDELDMGIVSFFRKVLFIRLLFSRFLFIILT